MHFGKLLFKTNGRIGRGVWWLTQIGVWVSLSITLWMYHFFGFHDALFGAILTFIMFGVRLNLNIKRLHDRNKSGWWMVLFEFPIAFWLFLWTSYNFSGWLFFLLPIVGFCTLWGFFELGCRGSDEASNVYGPPAKRKKGVSYESYNSLFDEVQLGKRKDD